MRTRRLVIFDAFNTLVTARPGSQDTFLAGLRGAGFRRFGIDARGVAGCRRGA